MDSIDAMHKSKSRFRPRFRLRTFLVVVTIFCVWLGWHIHGTRRQREVVAAIREDGGRVLYSYEMRPDPADRKSRVPEGVRNALGDDFFHAVVGVALERSVFGHPSVKSSSAGFDFGRLSQLPQLKFLHVWGRRPNHEELDQIAQLPGLRSLVIGCPQFSDNDLVRLASLRSLQQVYMPDAAMGDASMKVFSQMPELRFLDVGGYFTDEGVRHLGRLEKLQQLGLYRTGNAGSPVTDASLAFLLELPKFDELNVKQTQVSDEFLERVQERFPKCKIVK